MARPKKTTTEMSVVTMTSPKKREIPTKLSIDYHSEGLNNMAMKINEIIDYLHG